jgi:hypothetical protein
MTWLILLHRHTAKPAYERVKVWRRLQAIGAVQIQGGAWLLPARKPTRVAFEGLVRELHGTGGSAVLAQVDLLAGMSDGEAVSLFQAARDRDYRAVIAALPLVRSGARVTAARRAEIAAALGRARRRLAEIEALDQFGAPGREAAAAAIEALEHAVIPVETPRTAELDRADLRGRVWVTRRGVHVDRMACAWLIRRFLDPAARFRFVPGLGYRRRKRELRFDMAEAEFTHVGDRCSFEVLCERARLDDPALTAIGELVHDLDLEDRKFDRPETAGLRCVIRGIVASYADDLARIERAAACFDDLYESFRRIPWRRLAGRSSSAS